ncbi:MAG: hypothetical protein AAFX08_09905 [Pseudomonadota bacterium]
MKKMIIAAVAAAAFSAPAIADELYDACMGVLETVELPEGVSVEALKPNCQCVVDKAGDGDVRANLLETAAMPAEERDAATTPEAQAVIGACFEQPAAE